MAVITEFKHFTEDWIDKHGCYYGIEHNTEKRTKKYGSDYGIEHFTEDRTKAVITELNSLLYSVINSSNMWVRMLQTGCFMKCIKERERLLRGLQWDDSCVSHVMIWNVVGHDTISPAESHSSASDASLWMPWACGWRVLQSFRIVGVWLLQLKSPESVAIF